MFPQHPSHSAEMLRRILVESSIKQEDVGNRTEQAVLDGQHVENVDGPVDVSAAGRIGIGSYSWDSVIADAMLSTAAAPAVHQASFRRQYNMLPVSSALATDSDSEVAHELALSPQDLEETVNDEADQSEMLRLNIDHDSSGNDLLFTNSCRLRALLLLLFCKFSSFHEARRILLGTDANSAYFSCWLFAIR